MRLSIEQYPINEAGDYKCLSFMEQYINLSHTIQIALKLAVLNLKRPRYPY